MPKGRIHLAIPASAYKFTPISFRPSIFWPKTLLYPFLLINRFIPVIRLTNIGDFMGEWGKWWSGRGKDQSIKCVFCGRNVPKHKAVQTSSGGRLSRDIYEVAEVVSMGGVKAHACISCAKHRHLVKDGIHTTEKEKWAKKRAKDKREMDKVMVKVKEMEKKEGVAAKKVEHKPYTASTPKTQVPKAEAPKIEVPKPEAATPEAPKVAEPAPQTPTEGQV